MGKDPDGNYTNKNASGISAGNNSTAVLGAGSTFTGDYEIVTGISSITVNVDSDLVGTLFADFSQDGVTVTATVTRSFTNVSSGQNYTFIPAAKYMRVRYTNTAGTQAFFSFPVTI